MTTVNANATRLPTHKVTTVVRTARGASPSRRSEVLALALILLGTGAVVIGSFTTASRASSWTKTESRSISARPSARAQPCWSAVSPAPARTPGSYAEGLDRYLRGIAARRPERLVLGSDGRAGIGTDQAASLADRIADDLV